MNTAYEAAREEHNKAQAIYNAAILVFRAGGSYEAFGEAQAAKKIADAAFDEAFEAAANLPEEVEAIAEDDTQFALFA